MSQLTALIWLKWTLFRNAMRSRKAVVGRVAATLGTLASLTLALMIATALGFATYFMTSPQSLLDAPAAGVSELTGFLFLLTLFAFLYLMWAVVPLGIGGGGGEFDPGRLLLYPISLSKLFVVDVASELTSLASIFAVPIVCAVAIGAGVANGGVGRGLIAGGGALVFGIVFAKLVSMSVGTLMRRRRSRGETALALLGAGAGLAGAFLGQLVPLFGRYGESLRVMRWTPPGAIAVALTDGLRAGGDGAYLSALATLAAYTALFVLLAYRVARRAAMGAGGARHSAAHPDTKLNTEVRVGWELPPLSPELTAVVEKELRYAARNAQLRMVALMPLILIGVRAMQRGGAGRGGDSLSLGVNRFTEAFTQYGDGLVAAGGVLYVFMILTSVSCNLFAFDDGGMRALILSPVKRRTILVGKNIAVICLAFFFSALLLVINQIVFRDLSPGGALFATLCFVPFAALFAIVGNWLSIYFPKRLQFGKRLSATGVTGLLVIPIVVVAAVLPLSAIAAGYVAQSLVVKYATLALSAAVAIALYGLIINGQGRSLMRRESDVLEAVSGRAEN
ncbi:MAG: hypothetical protein M3R15_22695 [Acidobacteriota bacterium]|nr:hypothetical protein [Acidobacteriota bacterium]